MMKTKGLSLLLVLVMLVSFFTGCGEVQETPTDAVASAVESTVNENATADESSAVSQQEETSEIVNQRDDTESKGETKKQEAAQTVSSLAATSSKENANNKGKEESANTNTAGNANQDLHADEVPWIPPNFTSVEGFHSWLQTGGIEEEKRGELLNNVKDSPTYSDTTYLRPKLGDGNDWFTLSEIEAYPYSVIYRYGFVKNPSLEMLKITIYINPIDMKEISDDMQQRYDEINTPEDRVYDKYGSATVNQITYYYYHYPANDSITVYWKIGENTFKAKYYGDYDQINEILPLLELEQMEYKAGDNTVTK